MDSFFCTCGSEVSPGREICDSVRTRIVTQSVIGHETETHLAPDVHQGVTPETRQCIMHMERVQTY